MALPSDLGRCLQPINNPSSKQRSPDVGATAETLMAGGGAHEEGADVNWTQSEERDKGRRVTVGMEQGYIFHLGKPQLSSLSPRSVNQCVLSAAI